MSSPILPVSIGAHLKGSPVGAGYPIFATQTQVATGANLSETDFIVPGLILPAGLLDVDGRAIYVQAFGSFAATANTKRVRLYFGTTVVADTAAIAVNNAIWRVEAYITRTGPAAQLWRNVMQHGGTALPLALGVSAENLATNLPLRVTGQNGTAAANDIVFRGARVELV
jgi:hypothetical protein